MSLYRITDASIEPVPSKPFAELKISERGDLQRLLREAIGVISPETLVIAEEFSDWEDSRRRIDLLGLHKSGDLVVIELKRTEDGGHMELQAIRYAAMISAMTFEKVVEIYSGTLAAQDKEGDAHSQILGHLGWLASDEGQIAANVRIVLASADFNKEITTSVLWLNDQGLDITCIRLTAYPHGDAVLLDVQQVLPLPEAADYTVRLREKSLEVRSHLRERNRSCDTYTVTIGTRLTEPLPRRRAIFELVRFIASKGVSPPDLQVAIGQKHRFYRVEGNITTEEEFLEKAPQAIALNEDKSFNPMRWFTEDQALLHHDGSTFVFSNQWGQWTEKCMTRLVEAYAAFGIAFKRADDVL